MKKKISLLMALTVMVFVLSACAGGGNPANVEPINADSTGFFSQFIVWPLSQFITWVANIFGGNYGLGIIGATVVVRFAILPLMIKQIKSTKAMQVMQPEMKALQQKYSSKDQATQQKLQQETMGLYKKYGVNPLAGCLPLLIQMPILIGFFQAITRTEAIATQQFLWFDLGSPDALFILPILAAITTFISQRISMSGPAGDNQQMKMMLYVMPIMIGVFGLQMPAALGLYWVIGNFFQVFQSLVIKGPEMAEHAKEHAKARRGK